MTATEREMERDCDYTAIEYLCDLLYSDRVSANRALACCMAVYDDLSNDDDRVLYRQSGFRTLHMDACGSGDM